MGLNVVFPKYVNTPGKAQLLDIICVILSIYTSYHSLTSITHCVFGKVFLDQLRLKVHVCLEV